MILGFPPPLLRGDFNTEKQLQVFHLVWDPEYDELAPPEEGAALHRLLPKVHDPDYVKAVLALETKNGWGARSEFQLSHILLSNRSIVSLVNEVLLKDAPVGFAPVSGFHHAGYNSNWGYCTFNGLVLAAYAAHQLGLADQVLILDGDGHYGDGTENLINHHGWDSWLHHEPLDRGSVRGSPTRALERVKRVLGRRYDLVLYQAGADAHKEDPYGVGYLSDEDWKLRDSTVFWLCKETHSPVVWNLAGGYNGKKTILLHTSTADSAAQVYFPGQFRLPAGPAARAKMSEAVSLVL